MPLCSSFLLLLLVFCPACWHVMSTPRRISSDQIRANNLCLLSFPPRPPHFIFQVEDVDMLKSLLRKVRFKDHTIQALIDGGFVSANLVAKATSSKLSKVDGISKADVEKLMGLINDGFPECRTVDGGPLDFLIQGRSIHVKKVPISSSTQKGYLTSIFKNATRIADILKECFVNPDKMAKAKNSIKNSCLFSLDGAKSPERLFTTLVQEWDSKNRSNKHVNARYYFLISALLNILSEEVGWNNKKTHCKEAIKIMIQNYSLLEEGAKSKASFDELGVVFLEMDQHGNPTGSEGGYGVVHKVEVDGKPHALKLLRAL